MPGAKPIDQSRLGSRMLAPIPRRANVELDRQRASLVSCNKLAALEFRDAAERIDRQCQKAVCTLRSSLRPRS